MSTVFQSRLSSSRQALNQEIRQTRRLPFASINPAKAREFQHEYERLKQVFDLSPLKRYPAPCQQSTADEQAIASSNMEYIVYACDQSEVNLADLEQAYALLTTYRFPMNCNPLHQATINQLSAEQQLLMLEHEGEFIRQQLVKINPALRLFALPKSLYQLLAVVADDLIGVEEDILKVDRATRRPGLHTLQPNFDYQLKQGDFDLYCYEFMRLGQLKLKWCHTNGVILKLFAEMKCPFPAFEHEQLLKLLDFAVDFLANRSYSKNQMLFKGRGVRASKAFDVAKVVIDREWANRYRPDLTSIYRGTRTAEWQWQKQTCATQLKSLSYSDGLFAGIFYDIETGMAFRYASKQACSLYVVDINKVEYFRHGHCFHAFSIPPLSSLATLLGSGEFHHPRTKLNAATEIVKSSQRDRANRLARLVGLNLEGVPKNSLQNISLRCLLFNNRQTATAGTELVSEQIELASQLLRSDCHCLHLNCQHQDERYPDDDGSYQRRF